MSAAVVALLHGVFESALNKKSAPCGGAPLSRAGQNHICVNTRSFMTHPTSRIVHFSPPDANSVSHLWVGSPRLSLASAFALNENALREEGIRV